GVTMGGRGLPWYRRVQLVLVHKLSLPLQRFFSRVVTWEYGLDVPAVTPIRCCHTPLAGRRAVQLSDLHIERYLPRHDAIISQISDLHPEWIFITGDLLETPRGIPALFRFLKPPTNSSSLSDSRQPRSFQWR